MTPPFLVATKLEAFRGRGRGDYLGSRDVEDFIALVDGRAELVGEIANSSSELREYLKREIADLLAAPRFLDALFGFLAADIASQKRAETVILPRLRSMLERSS